MSVVRLTADRKRSLPSLRSGSFASLAGFAGWSAPGHHSFQATENGEGEDYTAELGLFEVAAEQVGEGPDLGGSLGEVGCHAGALDGLQACSPVERGAVLGIITRSYP